MATVREFWQTALLLTFAIVTCCPAQADANAKGPCGIVRQKLTVPATECLRTTVRSGPVVELAKPDALVRPLVDSSVMPSSPDCSCSIPELISFMPSPETICRSHLVLGVQQQLSELGYKPGPPDGILTPQTLHCLKLLQSSCGTGEQDPLGERTLAALERLYQAQLSPVDRSVLARLMTYPKRSLLQQSFPAARGKTIVLNAPEARSMDRRTPDPVSANPYHIVLFRKDPPSLARELSFHLSGSENPW